MNKHFEDSHYYLSRAAEHARLGVTETLEAAADRVRTRFGRGSDSNPDPSRADRVRDRVTSLENRAETRTRKALAGVRNRVGAHRSSDTDDDR